MRRNPVQGDSKTRAPQSRPGTALAFGPKTLAVFRRDALKARIDQQRDRFFI
jgi:hypothetical protein